MQVSFLHQVLKYNLNMAKKKSSKPKENIMVGSEPAYSYLR